MTRLIDADKLFKVIAEQEMWNIPNFVYESIKNAPTIDAVEVVRCKDCRTFYGGECDKLGYTRHVRPNDFCSWGEKNEIN